MNEDLNPQNWSQSNDSASEAPAAPDESIAAFAEDLGGVASELVVPARRILHWKQMAKGGWVFHFHNLLTVRIEVVHRKNAPQPIYRVLWGPAQLINTDFGSGAEAKAAAEEALYPLFVRALKDFYVFEDPPRRSNE